MSERLDRDAVARILDRAQAIAERHDGEAIDVGVEPEALIEAAEEVGIDPNAVRDSLAVERFGVEAGEAERFDSLAGPAAVMVERELAVTATEAIDRLERWLTAVHRMSCDRRSPTQLVARRRTDSAARVGRQVAATRGDGRLGTVQLLRAEAVPQMVGATPSTPKAVIRLSADRSTPRSLRIGGGAAVSGSGIGAGAAVAAATDVIALWPVVGVPMVVGGYAITRSGRSHADRLELELERLLSAIGRGEMPTGLLEKVARRALARRR